MTQPKKVMIVDNEKDFLEELSEVLNCSGYESIEVDDCTYALSAACSSKPDVILLDLRMPLMSGFEVAALLRHTSETSKIPIIAISGYYTMKEHDYLANMCGIQKFLSKPLNPLDIIKEIEWTLKE